MGKLVTWTTEPDSAFVDQLARECAFEHRAINDGDRLQNECGKDLTGGVLISVASAQQLDHLEKLGLNRNRVHAIVGLEDSQLVHRTFHSPAIGHVVVRRFTNPAENARQYATVLKAASGEGSESLLKANDNIRVIVFDDTVQKGFVSNGVFQYLLENNCSERVSSVIAGAVDELLMNAVYDAPVDQKGEQLYRHHPRSNEISLKGIEMHLRFDEEVVAVTVIDRVGSLNRDQILLHVAKSLNDGKMTPRDASYAGAGLGLALIFRSGGSLSYITEKGKRTEATVFFRRSKSFREFKNQFQFVSTHIFEK